MLLPDTRRPVKEFLAFESGGHGGRESGALQVRLAAA